MERTRTLAALWLIGGLLSPLVAQDEVLTNPGFDLDEDGNGLPDGWNTSAQQIHYREIVAFGKDWELVSKPGQYVLATQDLKLVKGETYTITVEAKGTPEAAAGALLVQGERRPEQEFPLIWRQAVRPEYRLYTRVFTAPNPVARLYLYNVTKVGEVCYRRVSLRRGTPDYPIIRDALFRDIDRPLGPPNPTPHEVWARPLAGGPLKVFFAVQSYRYARDYVELAQRLEMTHDVVQTTAAEAVSPAGVDAQQRLVDGAYDAYWVGHLTPEPMQRTIVKHVRDGRGLVVFDNGGRPATGLFDWRTLPEAPPDHPLRRDLPWPLMRGDLLAEVRAGELGAGRVVYVQVRVDQGRVRGLIPRPLDQSDWERRTLRDWEYWYAFAGRCLAWAARRDHEVPLKVAADARGVTVTGALPAGAVAELRFRSGREIRFGEPDLSYAAVPVRPGQAVSWPAGFPAGAAVADVLVRNAGGQVLAWAGLPCERPGAAPLAEAEVTPASVAPGGLVKLTARSPAAGRVEARLVDAYGRACAAQAAEVAAGGTVALELSTARTASAGNKLFVKLIGPGGRELDSRWWDVLVPELNRRQAWSDWQVTAWGEAVSHPSTSHQYNLLMRDLGLNAKFHSYPYGSVEDGLWPAYTSGARGFWPGDRRSPERFRPAGCLSDPAFYDKMAEGIALAVPPQKPYGIVAWAIGDEISLTNRHEVDEVDCAPASVAAYHAWLAKRYGTIAALNREWGTTHADFAAIVPAATGDVRGQDNFAPFVDFRTFMTDEWVRALTAAVSRIREADPDGRVGHTNTFGSLPFNGVDFYKICTIPGFDWGQEYSEAIKGQAQKAVFACWRSFCPEDFPNLGWIGYDRREVAAAYEPWWLAFHGSRGASYFATNACDLERNASWALIHPTLAYTRYSLAVKESLRDLVTGCGKALMVTKPPEPEVAILWSHPSMLASWCESHYDKPEPPDKPPFDSWGAYFRCALNLRLLLEDRGVDYRYLAPQQIAADRALLARYKAVILPATCALDRGTIDALKAYQQGGGLVLGDVNLLRYDEHGAPWRGASPLEELFGAKATGPVSWQETRLSLTGVELAGFGWQPLQVTGGAAGGRHADGQPCWIRSQRGQGGGLLLNTMLRYDDPAAPAVIQAVLETAGLARPVRVERQGGTGLTGCSVTRRMDGQVELVGVIRDHRLVPKDETEPPPVTIHFGRAAYVSDLRERKSLGRIDRLTVPMAPGQARLYSLLPYQVAAVEVTVPEPPRVGQDLVFTARVRASAPPGRHVFRVELVAPDGSIPAAYARTLAADAGVLQDQLPLADNDPPGRWTLRVREVLTGVMGQAVLGVRPR